MLLHGDAPFGWRGFVFAAVLCVVLVVLVYELAARTMKSQCSFHYPLMVHGSFENHTDKSRRAVVLNVFRDGVVSASDAAPLDGVPPSPVGHKMDGQFFPHLFDPEN